MGWEWMDRWSASEGGGRMVACFKGRKSGARPFRCWWPLRAILSLHEAIIASSCVRARVQSGHALIAAICLITASRPDRLCR